MKRIKNWSNLSIIGLIVSLGLFLIVYAYMSISNIDESFTMSLISHSWIHVIEYDALDIHPPLYYLLLKLFLVVTTFWTRDLAVKFVMARVFSLLCLFLTFIILCKILNLMLIKYSYGLLFVLLVLASFWIGELVSIRMYSFATLLIALELLGIVKYEATRHNGFLWLTLLGASGATYTQDFSALIAGLLILLLLVKSLVWKNNHDAHKWLRIVSLMVILYLPWLYASIKQVTGIPAAHWISKITAEQDSKLFIVTVVILECIVLALRKHLNKGPLALLQDLFIVSFLTIVIIIIGSMLLHRAIVEIRFLYPLMMIDIGVAVPVIDSVIRSSRHKIWGVSLWLVSFLTLWELVIGPVVIQRVQRAQQIHQTTEQFVNNYELPNRNQHEITRINVNGLIAGGKQPNNIYALNTYAQYSHKLLPKYENRLITRSSIANRANQGNHPRLRFLVWHAGR